jgi:hypothetical protein
MRSGIPTRNSASSPNPDRMCIIPVGSQSPHIDVLKDITQHRTLEPYIKGVIGHFKDDKRVLCWDLYNEPGNDDEKKDKMNTREKEAVGLALLERMFTWAREVNPTQPLTTGVWSNAPHGEWVGPHATALNTFILANSDIISFHSYDNFERTVERTGSLMTYQRPLLCTEYLARGNGSTFQTHLPYFKKNKIAAYNWGLVAGKIQTQYPWSSWRKEFTAEPEVWHHDVLRPDGKPYDPAEVELIKSLTNDEKTSSGKIQLLHRLIENSIQTLPVTNFNGGGGALYFFRLGDLGSQRLAWNGIEESRIFTGKAGFQTGGQS